MSIFFKFTCKKQDQNDRFICAGTIITEKFILTPASCVHKKRSEKLRMLTAKGTRIEIDSIKFHEEFKVLDGKVSNDIAILQTTTDIPQDYGCVTTLSKTNRSNKPDWGEHFIVANWITKPSNDPVNKEPLRVNFVRTYNNETCSSQFNHSYDMTKNFCLVTTDPVYLKPICENYLGGPVGAFHTSYLLSWDQFGIIVKSSSDCFFNKRFPKLAIMVWPYFDWIKKNSVYNNNRNLKEKSKKRIKSNDASSFRAFSCLKLLLFALLSCSLLNKFLPENVFFF